MIGEKSRLRSLTIQSSVTLVNRLPLIVDIVARADECLVVSWLTAVTIAAFDLLPS